LQFSQVLFLFISFLLGSNAILAYGFKIPTNYVPLLVLQIKFHNHKQEVLGRTNRLLSFDTMRTAEKTTSPTILFAAGTSLPSSYLLIIGGPIWTQRHKSLTILLLLLVFIAAGTCLPNRCLSSKKGIDFTKLFPSNERKNTHTDTQTDGKDLCGVPLRKALVLWCIYQDLWRSVQALRR
jgi:hypothetical protein